MAGTKQVRHRRIRRHGNIDQRRIRSNRPELPESKSFSHIALMTSQILSSIFWKE
jgi:hypothetical protein